LVVNELENDVKKLTKQAEKAKLYDEKRKELMHLELTILVKDIKYYKEQLDKINVELKESKNELEVFEPDVKQIQQTLSFSKEKAEIADKNIEVLSTQLTDLIEQINKAELRKANISSELKNQISSDNVEKQAEAYRQLLSTTKFELDDAKNKTKKLQGEIEGYQDIVNSLTTKRNELANTSSTQAIKIAEVRMQIKAIEEEIHNRSHMDFGVKTIIDNKRALSGIHGIVKDLLTVEAQYEKAVLTALGKSLQDVVVEDTTDAQQAVEFLKSNRAGKATFLPLNTIKPRNVKPEIVEALKTRPGFINIANQLVTFESKFENIFAFLLGNVIIAEDLNAAIALSKYAYQLYRVISLDGDVVGAGGAITGGFNKINPALSVNLEAKQKELAEQFQSLDASLTECRIELDKITAELNEVNSKQYEKKLTLSKYEEVIKINESHYFEYEMHYDQLVKSHNLADKRDQ
jgi:chromosome segregation protein